MSAIRAVKRFPYVAAIVLVIVLIFTVIPLYWMVTSSLKTSAELSQIPVTLWPQSFTAEQYVKLFQQSTIGLATVQSLAIAVLTTILVVAFGSGAAYAVQHLKFRAGRPLLSLSLVTQFLPQAATLVPIFIVWAQLGLINSLPGVTLIYVAFQLPVAVWLLSGYFSSIPKEIIDAADVDGSGPIRTLFQVVMPMAAPGIAAVAIWCTIGSWSELLFALILLNGDSGTVPVVLSGLIGEHGTDPGVLLAGATIATLPPLILFFFVQRYFTDGLTGAVKG